jgi:hypothetical protein
MNIVVKVFLLNRILLGKQQHTTELHTSNATLMLDIQFF